MNGVLAWLFEAELHVLGSGFYPSALLYAFYGVFCVAGFLIWLQADRRLRRAVPADAVAAGQA